MKRKLQDRILARGRQRVLRHRLMPYEPAASVAVLFLLVLTGVWVARHRDRFDPKERGVGIDFLRKERVRLADGQRGARKLSRSDAPTKAAVDLPIELLPPGWHEKTARTFSPETLYEKVDGQAEQYLKFGFRNLDFVTMAKGGATIDLYLYDQGSSANALGLFAEMRGPDEPVKRDGTMHYLANAVGSYGILGRFFFQLIGSGARAGPLEAARRKLLDLPSEPASSPVPLRRFEAMAIPFDRISYEPSDVFQFDFARDFWFADLDTNGTERLFLHQAASPEAAAALLDRLLTAGGEEYEKVGEVDGVPLLKHRFLKTFSLMITKGSLLLGVEGAKDKSQAKAALGRLVESKDAG